MSDQFSQPHPPITPASLTLYPGRKGSPRSDAREWLTVSYSIKCWASNQAAVFEALEVRTGFNFFILNFVDFTMKVLI